MSETEREERLARALHEAGRAAVEAGLTVAKQPGPFLGWNAITPAAREGRRVQARWLIAHGWITPRGGDVPGDTVLT